MKKISLFICLSFILSFIACGERVIINDNFEKIPSEIITDIDLGIEIDGADINNNIDKMENKKDDKNTIEFGNKLEDIGTEKEDNIRDTDNKENINDKEEVVVFYKDAKKFDIPKASNLKETAISELREDYRNFEDSILTDSFVIYNNSEKVEIAKNTYQNSIKGLDNWVVLTVSKDRILKEHSLYDIALNTTIYGRAINSLKNIKTEFNIDDYPEGSTYDIVPWMGYDIYTIKTPDGEEITERISTNEESIKRFEINEKFYNNFSMLKVDTGYDIYDLENNSYDLMAFVTHEEIEGIEPTNYIEFLYVDCGEHYIVFDKAITAQTHKV